VNAEWPGEDGDIEFIEEACRYAIEVCEERDPKGMYGVRAEAKYPTFTGISSALAKYRKELTSICTLAKRGQGRTGRMKSLNQLTIPGDAINLFRGSSAQ
jgi:adenylylsulfate kinase-like enzyme